MDLLHFINSIMENDNLDSLEAEESKCESLENLIALFG